MDMSIKDGTEFVKKKLERDFSKLSDRAKGELKARYDTIMKVLFVENKKILWNNYKIVVLKIFLDF